MRSLCLLIAIAMQQLGLGLMKSSSIQLGDAVEPPIGWYDYAFKRSGK